MNQIKIRNLISKMEGMRDYLDKTIKGMKEEYQLERPRCFRCGWADLRIRKDKTYFCRSCGFDTNEGETK